MSEPTPLSAKIQILLATHRPGLVTNCDCEEPSRVRGRSCAAGGLTWRGDDVDAQVDRAIVTMGADERWFEEAAELASKSAPTVDVGIVERERLLAKRESIPSAIASPSRSGNRFRLEVLGGAR